MGKRPIAWEKQGTKEAEQRKSHRRDKGKGKMRIQKTWGKTREKGKWKEKPKKRTN